MENNNNINTYGQGFSQPGNHMFETYVTYNPNQLYVQNNTLRAPRSVNMEQSPTQPTCIVYGFGGICGAVLFLIVLLGILIHIYWLGIFGFLALVPGFFILWLLYWWQYKEYAFLSRVVKFLVCGMLGVVPVAIIEGLITYGFLTLMNSVDIATLAEILLGSFVNAFFVASLCEETFKYFLAVLVTVKPGRDAPYSVLVYSVAGAVGLATLENMMYIIVVGMRGNLVLTVYTACTRAIMAVPLHATTGVLIGADVAENRFGYSNKNFFRVISIPFVLHGIYDFCTMFASAYILAHKDQYWVFFMPVISLLVVIVGVFYAHRRRQQILERDSHLYIAMGNMQTV